MWLPEWLYERLPVLYVGCSGACLLGLGVSFPSTLSSTLLLAAALLTHSRRRSARETELRPTRRAVC